MNAEDAKILTHVSAMEHVSDIRTAVDSLIEKAAKEGKSSIYYFDAYRWSEPVRKALFKALEEDKYTVSYIQNPDPGNPCSTSYYQISW
jgi:hypothetical protein